MSRAIGHDRKLFGKRAADSLTFSEITLRKAHPTSLDRSDLPRRRLNLDLFEDDDNEIGDERSLHYRPAK